jgi:peptidoglycan/LPS O-acetylase OafA/YrhL
METASTTDKPGAHMPQLDGLRAIAALLVVYAHWLPLHFRAGLPVGGMGVLLFFVISGFLITGILLRCRSLAPPGFSLRAFYARRALRIFPLYYLVLAVTFALNVEGVREMFVWHASYLSNFYFFLRDDWNGYTSHFWTLAVEEQFYLCWPLLMLLLPENRLALATSLLIGIGIASHFLLPILFPERQLVLTLPSFAFPALGSGALLALAAVGKVRPFASLCAIGVPAFVVFQVLRSAGLSASVTRPARDLAFIVVATWLVGTAATGFRGPVGRILSWSPLTYLGRISYGIYLLHHLATPTLQAVGQWLQAEWLLHGPWKYAARAALTVGAASLSWACFEGPLNRLKDRFPYRKP